MKQNKLLIKIFVPILLFFIALFSMHFIQGVDVYMEKYLQRINNTRGMYDISIALDKYIFEEKKLTKESPEFLELYKNWEFDYMVDGYNYKSIFNKELELENFELVTNVDFDADIRMAKSGMEGYGISTIDLSLLDTLQKEKVVTILKDNYQQKITFEVQGARGVDGAIEDALSGETDYVYERIIASYLKINDTVIIGSNPSTVITGDFIEYYDENMYLVTGYDFSTQTQPLEKYGRYVNIEATRNVFMEMIKKDWDHEQMTLVTQGKSEVNGDYYIINTIPLTLSNRYITDFLASITVIPDLRTNMQSEFIEDTMMLYAGFVFIFIVSMLITKFTVLRSTKNIIEKIEVIKNEYGIESIKSNTLKGSVLQLDAIQEKMQVERDSLSRTISTLQQELVECKPKEIIEKTEDNEIAEIVDTIILKYTRLLENKRVTMSKDITTNHTRYSKEDLEKIITKICNSVIYQVAMQGTIYLTIDTSNITIKYTRNTKVLQNIIDIDKGVKDILENYQSSYKVEENKQIISIIISC